MSWVHFLLVLELQEKSTHHIGTCMKAISTTRILTEKEDMYVPFCVQILQICRSLVYELSTLLTGLRAWEEVHIGTCLKAINTMSRRTWKKICTLYLFVFQGWKSVELFFVMSWVLFLLVLELQEKSTLHIGTCMKAISTTRILT